MNRLHGWIAFGGLALTTAACAVTPSQGNEATSSDDDAYTIADGVVLAPRGIMRTVDAYKMRSTRSVAQKPVTTAPSGALLTDHGGKVVASPRYTNVFWGSYYSSGAGASEATYIDGFMQKVGTSVDFASVLEQYSKTGQTIGPASFTGHVFVSSEPGSSIDDTTIQSQLQSWIDAGTVPAPDDNTIYSLVFPPNTSITLQGSGSCTEFCGYHMTFNSTSGQVVRYMVLPHLDCAGCGFESVMLDSETVVLSHEMSEATTDPNVGLAIATNDNSWLGWYDDNNGEIGDICAGDPDSTLMGYAIQTEWSNADNGCVATRSVQEQPDYSLAATPDTATGRAGTRVRYKVTSTATGGFTGAIKLWVKGLPAGTKSSFSSTLAGSGTTILRVTSSTSTPAGTYTLTVKSQSGSITHSVPVTLVVD